MILIPECPNTIIALSNIEVGRQRIKQRNATIVNIISSVVFVPNFITNNFEVDALTIALLHKHRWQIELFFNWIYQHWRIKTFWGTSSNAVKTQIWIAVCTYLLVAYAKKQLKSDSSLYEITQIISVSTFDKAPLNEALTNFPKNDEI